MFGIANEFKNVPLGNPDMFQEMPRCVGDIGRPTVAVVRLEIGHSLIESQMGNSSTQEKEQLFSYDLISTHVFQLLC